MALASFCAKFGAVSGIALSSSWACAAAPTESITRYLAAAHAIVADLGHDAPNAQSIAASITDMLNDAKPVVTAYADRHTQCTAQLQRVLALYPEIDSWTGPQIRRDIEGGAALPPAEGCYPARDIIAHPAIVRAFARLGIQPEQRARLIREMNEAIEHMDDISIELTQE